MKDREYRILKTNCEIEFSDSEFWNDIPTLYIDQYLWLENNYTPKVEVKVCYSNEYLFAYFKVYENEITARFVQVNDPVYKDSCVEFFLNLFPSKTEKYFNFEMSAIGTIYVGFGTAELRSVLPIKEIDIIEIHSSIIKPFIGKIEHDYWEVFYKIPFDILEKYYDEKFVAGNSKGNFYKCGDESKYEHYGTWNDIVSPKPNFHLPKYFGDLIFVSEIK